MRLIRFVLYFFVALLGLVFAVLNAQTVPFNYYFGMRELPLAFIVAMALALGAFLGVSASLTLVVKAKRQTAGYRKNATVVEKELAYLRSLSINDKP